MMTSCAISTLKSEYVIYTKPHVRFGVSHLWKENKLSVPLPRITKSKEVLVMTFASWLVSFRQNDGLNISLNFSRLLLSLSLGRET